MTGADLLLFAVLVVSVYHGLKGYAWKKMASAAIKLNDDLLEQNKKLRQIVDQADAALEGIMIETSIERSGKQSGLSDDPVLRSKFGLDKKSQLP